MSRSTYKNTSPRWDGRGKPVIAAVLVLALVTWGACSVFSGGDDERRAPAVSFEISYAGAAARLDGLAPQDAEEQLRDWARFALAAHLKLDTARFRDASYDTLPVRDAYFADLAEQPTGPGRALYDGAGVLHLLVPDGDPRASRTIGLLIDEHRADAGSDPPSVRVHRYRIRPEARTIQISSGRPEPTARVRSAHGYVTARVDTAEGLKGFLARTRHLSWLERRGQEIHAGGWNWKDGSAPPLDTEDVGAIQRGYLASSGRLPGFSLDPAPLRTAADVRAALPGVDARLADALATGNWTGSQFRSPGDLVTAVKGALFQNQAAGGLPSDRTQLWALLQLAQRQPAYSRARYDGGLQGSEVGMTLFYTDYVAKHWVSGAGEGVPAKAVAGFVPGSDAAIPWAHCEGAKDAKAESGRLWFGQNEQGFAFDGDRISIGPRATRLFARSDSASGGEEETSYGFGRGLRYWDVHYQAVADYEPQYRRLDQIMRWSGAVEWLTTRPGAPRLPQPDDGRIRSDLRFKDWYAQHRELRERAPIAFADVPSAAGVEGVVPAPSKTYRHCGLQRITGGVSLADLVHRGAPEAPSGVPAELRRAGPHEKSSTFDRASGQGRVEQIGTDAEGKVVDRVRRTLSPGEGGSSVVETEAGGRKVAPLGELKIARAETAGRRVEAEASAGQGQVTQRAEVEGKELGRLTARESDRTVTLQWRPGPLDRARRALESYQRRWGSGQPPAPEGVLYGAKGDGGREVFKVGERDWLSITDGVAPPGDEPAFRLGAPKPDDGTPRFATAGFVPPAKGVAGGAASNRGPPGWTAITPATPGRPARAVPAAPPGPDAQPIRVETPDGRSTTVYATSGGLLVASGDPIAGPAGSAEGAALARDFPRVDQARREAAQARDGLYRGIALGPDAVALAGADKVILAPNDHSYAGRVLQALGDDLAKMVPLIRVEQGRPLHVSRNRLSASDRAERAEMRLDEVPLSGDKDVYVHEKLRAQVFVDGPVVRDPLPHDEKVIVVEALIVPAPDAEVSNAAPDVYAHDGSDWLLVKSRPGTGQLVGPGPTSTPTSTASAAPPGGAPWPGARPGRHVLLVCPADGADGTVCDE
ncbi:hypothetical protein GCM10010191_74550 [Actinomadura vinacea]|uniref:Uncharacterized protein n=1 Tax=Actinomadura vinacea TaxID=115336 RepID=A0ABN3K4S3_9ACTN